MEYQYTCSILNAIKKAISGFMLSLALKCFKKRKPRKRSVKALWGFFLHKINSGAHQWHASRGKKHHHYVQKSVFFLILFYFLSFLKYSSLKVILFLKCIWKITGYSLLLDLCHCVSPWGTEKKKNRILIKLLSNSPSTVKNKINKDLT